MGCLTCGSGWKGSHKQLVSKFKKEYEDNGVERYVYRLNENDSFKTIKKSGFKSIFNKIKDNFPNGAEYFHISEWNPK